MRNKFLSWSGLIRLTQFCRTGTAIVDSGTLMPPSGPLRSTALPQPDIKTARPWHTSWRDGVSGLGQFTGYTRDFRAKVVKSALSAHDSMVKKDAEGEEPLYRPKGWKKVERVKARRAGKVDWFRKRKGEDSNKSVVFVPATPRGVMRNRYMEAIESCRGARTKLEAETTEIWPIQGEDVYRRVFGLRRRWRW